MERDDFSNDPKCRFQMFFDFVSDAMRVPTLSETKQHIKAVIGNRIACNKPPLKTIFVFDHLRQAWMVAKRTDEGLELEYYADPTAHPDCDRHPTTEAYWIHAVSSDELHVLLGNPWTAEGVLQDQFDVRREAVEYCQYHGGDDPLYMVSTRSGELRVWRIWRPGESATMARPRQG